MKRLLLSTLLILVLCGCGRTNEYSTDFFAMDTFMTITVYGKDAQTAAQAAEHSVYELENLISRTRESSDIAKLNAANGEPVAVNSETYELLQNIRKLCVPGVFDVTVASLSDLWCIGTEDAHVPQDFEISAALQTVSVDNINLLDNNHVQLLNGAKIDLGGIGKGIATDRCVSIIQNYDVSGALIALGGNIYVFGDKKDHSSWSVGVANPDKSADYIGTVSVKDVSIVTTGDYERYFEMDGKRYHHVFDPKTGFPAKSGLHSVTVVNSNSTLADARSTTLFVMGLTEGMKYCNENNLQAVFITQDKKVYVTPNLKDRFTFTGEGAGYTYVS